MFVGDCKELGMLRKKYSWISGDRERGPKATQF